MEIELLAPAGSWESLTAAVQSGADAVYLGGDCFSARQGADNFSAEQLERAVEYCRLYGVKVHTAVNTLVKEKELEKLVAYIYQLARIGVDAVIVQDMGAAQMFRQIVPDMPLHASTQMTVTSVDGVRALEDLGFERVVLARELSKDEIARICRETNAEIEVFCHGALCMCYSGQCLMSSMIGGRSGNRGRCAQPCRLPYTLLENGKAAADGYLLSMKDLSLIDELKTLKKIGVTSLKIEGRLKRSEYVAAVVGLYRKYLDSGGPVAEKDRQELLNAFNRSGFTKGYFSSQKGKMMMSQKTPGNVAEEKFSDEVYRRVRPDADIRKIPVRMSFSLRADETCSLAVSDGRNCVRIQGTQKSETARTRPLDAERIRAQLAKTGGTPFSAEQIHVNMEDGLALPVSELNYVRRAALDALAAHRRKRKAYPTLPYKMRQMRRAYDGLPELTVQVETMEQLRAAARYSIAMLYVPYRLYHQALTLLPPTKVAVVLPDITKNDMPQYTDAEIVLARNTAQLCQYADRRIYGDFRLNVYNSLAARFFCGLEAVTASPELNLKEIRALTEHTETPVEAIVYGQLPLMLTENCPIRSSCGKCGSNGRTYALKDRRGEIFPLMCGEGCVSVLLNGKRIFMADRFEDLLAAKINRARLLFTVENFSECDTIMNIYERAVRGEQVQNPFASDDFTRGHFYRGVL